MKCPGLLKRSDILRSTTKSLECYSSKALFVKQFCEAWLTTGVHAFVVGKWEVLLNAQHGKADLVCSLHEHFLQTKITIYFKSEYPPWRMHNVVCRVLIKSLFQRTVHFFEFVVSVLMGCAPDVSDSKALVWCQPEVCYCMIASSNDWGWILSRSVHFHKKSFASRFISLVPLWSHLAHNVSVYVRSGK